MKKSRSFTAAGFKIYYLNKHKTRRFGYGAQVAAAQCAKTVNNYPRLQSGCRGLEPPVFYLGVKLGCLQQALHPCGGLSAAEKINSKYIATKPSLTA
jgi:hypothetical protein